MIKKTENRIIASSRYFRPPRDNLVLNLPADTADQLAGKTFVTIILDKKRNLIKPIFTLFQLHLYYHFVFIYNYFVIR